MPTGAAASIPIGVYRGSGGVNLVGFPGYSGVGIVPIQEYEAWLGRRVDYVLASLADNPDSWTEFENGTMNKGDDGVVRNVNVFSNVLGYRQLLLTVSACAGHSIGTAEGSTGRTWADEAAGNNDAHWKALGAYLVANNLGTATLRIAREFNGGWYYWSVQNNTGPYGTANFIAGWQHIVEVLRAVPGAAFTFCWNPYIFQSGYGAEVQDTYPGDHYVDQIGLDIYDDQGYPGLTSPPYNVRTLAQQEAAWSNFLYNPDGLNSWLSFAQQHNKPLCFPEWGLKLHLQNGVYYGGGDDAYYMESMAEWLVANESSIGYHAFWERSPGYGVFDPDNAPGRLIPAPASRSMFLEWFQSTPASPWAVAPRPLGPHQITYAFADAMSGQVLAELPLTQVSFGFQVNQAASWQGTLQLEDPRMALLEWQGATVPGRSLIWIDVNGILVFGGIVWTRQYDRTAQTVQLGGKDLWSYFASRLQAKDYSTTWTKPTSPLAIAAQVINDALAVSGSLPIYTVATQGMVAPSNYVTATFPLSMVESVDEIVSLLSQMGAGVGIDYAVDVAYGPNGQPTATVNLSYPRRGRSGSASGLVLDVTSAVQFTWPEDASSQGDRIVEMSTSAGAMQVSQLWQPALDAGWPLLEQVDFHTDVNWTPLYEVSGQVEQTQQLLEAVAAGDLGTSAYPLITPTLTIPAFGDAAGNPAIWEYIAGDDVRLLVPPVAGPGVVGDPRFPGGLDMSLRITQIGVTVADEGLSTAELTFNFPPTTVPVAPPT
jgi:hypothetical protein